MKASNRAGLVVVLAVVAVIAAYYLGFVAGEMIGRSSAPDSKTLGHVDWLCGWVIDDRGRRPVKIAVGEHLSILLEGGKKLDLNRCAEDTKWP